MRFKPPPPNSTIGWRVEFRSMEVQLSDFENAAYSVFIVLLTRVILSFGLNFYIPLSKVDANMQTAHKRDAVLNDKFYFRKNVFTSRAPNDQARASVDDTDEDEYELMTMNEIVNGKVNTGMWLQDA
jgi:glutamate--cysteine ligase catalytic subunit